MISSPIPVDPGYHGKNGRGQSSSMIDTRPVPRVRPEAEVIATKAQGSVGLLLQLQGQPVYRAPVVRKPEPKNFSQENVRRMRKIQAMSRKKKAEETIIKNQPVKVLPQSEKYKEVQSKVAAHIQQVPPAPRPASANYLRSYSRAGSAPPRVRCPSPEPRERFESQPVQGKNVSLEVRGCSRHPAPQSRDPAPRSRDLAPRSRDPAPKRRPETADPRGRSSNQDLQKRRPETADPRGRSSNQDLQKRRPETADPRGRSTSQDPAQRRPPAAGHRGRSTSQDPAGHRGRSTSQGPAGHRGRSVSPGPRPSSGSSGINFIAHNARLARKHQSQRPPSAMAQTALDDKRKTDMEKYNKGEVPKYLRSRQQHWQDEENERIRNIPDPEMPPGHKMMPKEEQKKTLNILKEKEKELQLQLHKVPLNPETLRAKTLKTDIETKLAEVDEAIKIFSRNKVFIKVDS